MFCKKIHAKFLQTGFEDKASVRLASGVPLTELKNVTLPIPQMFCTCPYLMEFPISTKGFRMAKPLYCPRHLRFFSFLHRLITFIWWEFHFYKSVSEGKASVRRSHHATTFRAIKLACFTQRNSRRQKAVRIVSFSSKLVFWISDKQVNIRILSAIMKQ